MVYSSHSRPTRRNFLLRRTQYIENQVKKVIGNKDKAGKEKEKRTIIREIFESDLPAGDRTAHALEQEAQTFVAAGTASTARVLESTIFYILDNPSITQKLVAEVRQIGSDSSALIPSRQLEQLPYLSAIVLEGLRMAPAVPSRFPRINRTSAMQYRDYSLPAGTVIGMSPWDVLGDESVFASASVFMPERWLDPEEKTTLQKHWVPFGRGSRNCVGQNLVMAEITLVLGNVFRRYDMELYETTEKEITIIQDCFVPFAYAESKGVRVTLRDPAKTK
jgi:cytochrome P450